MTFTSTRQRLKLALVAMVAGAFGFSLGLFDLTPAVMEQFSAMEIPVQAALLIALTALGTSIYAQITRKRIDRESRLHSQKAAAYSSLVNTCIEIMTTENNQDALLKPTLVVALWASLDVARDWIALKELVRSDSATEEQRVEAFGALLMSMRQDLGHPDLKLNWLRFLR